MEKIELIKAFIKIIAKDLFYDISFITGKNMYFLKYAKHIKADKSNQLLEFSFDQYITPKISFVIRHDTLIPVAKYKINGNDITREINDIKDFVDFLSILPFKKDYLSLFSRYDDSKRVYNKLSLMNYFLKYIKYCDSLYLSGENIGFNYGLFNVSLTPLDNQKFKVFMSFLDSALYSFNRTPPKGKKLTLEEKRKVVTNDYSRGVETGYHNEIIANDYLEACEEVNEFFENGYDILTNIRKNAGYYD